MTTSNRYRLFCTYNIALASACAVALLVGADDPAKSKPLVLFDGKTLDDWKPTSFPNPGDVKVEDGTILMPVGNAMTGITSTRKDLPTSNYELTYEAIRQSGGDFFAAATFPVGKSFATLVNGGWGGSVTGISSLNGADASENETSTSFTYKNKTWYKFRAARDQSGDPVLDRRQGGCRGLLRRGSGQYARRGPSESAAWFRDVSNRRSRPKGRDPDAHGRGNRGDEQDCSLRYTWFPQVAASPFASASALRTALKAADGSRLGLSSMPISPV